MSFITGLQFFTLREEIQTDFVGMLEKVAEIGYTGIEFGINKGGLSAAELKKHLERLGLTPIASLYGFDKLKEELEEQIEYNVELGSKYMGLGYAKYSSKEDYISMANWCNEIGEKCKKKGLQFYYHNHAHEFELYDGEYGLDILYKHCDSELVKTEIDTYWVQYAGVDPAKYIQKYAGRCPLVHLKDMENNEARDFAEIGNGILNFNNIITAAKESGAEYFIVEQDRCKRPPIESIDISYKNLKKLGL